MSILSGCIALPIPHDRPFSPFISGEVRAKSTWQPIPNATVTLLATTLAVKDETSTATDATGKFEAQVTHRKIWMPFFFGPAEGFCTSSVTISAPGYKSETHEFHSFGAASGKGVCAGAREILNVVLEETGQ